MFHTHTEQLAKLSFMCPDTFEFNREKFIRSCKWRFCWMPQHVWQNTALLPATYDRSSAGRKSFPTIYSSSSLFYLQFLLSKNASL